MNFISRLSEKREPNVSLVTSTMPANYILIIQCLFSENYF